MSAEQWTFDDTKTHIHDWACATDSQRAAAFMDLLAASCAVAASQQNEMVINTLREIHAMWVES